MLSLIVFTALANQKLVVLLIPVLSPLCTWKVYDARIGSQIGPLPNITRQLGLKFTHDKFDFLVSHFVLTDFSIKYQKFAK